VRLAIAGAAMMAVYLWVLLFVMKQKDFYFDLLRGLMKSGNPTLTPQTNQQV